MAAHTYIPIATAELAPNASERITRPFTRFAALSSAGGLLLLLCTIAAMVWANSRFGHSYDQFFHHTEFGFEFGSFSMRDHLTHWINDALMAVFFLLVGLEIKRELLVGELASVKRAALPIVAAIGGMLVPALIYTAFNYGKESSVGWGVPMATDIAFALGMLAILGKRIPSSLKVFLASLAIADDLGALLVIAIFYSDNLAWDFLGYAAITVALLIAINLLGFRRAIWYIIPGIFLWYFILESGVHATIAGVLLACTIPTHSRVDADRYMSYSRAALNSFERHSKHDPDIRTNAAQRAAVTALNKNGHFLLPLLHRMEHWLHPWVAFLIIPIFALANAGIEVHGGLRDALTGPISMGVILGLFVGKPVGVIGACMISTRLGIAALPKGVTWRHIIGAGFFAGIGFTMALFIGNLAFENSPEGLEHAKLGILTASALATIAGFAVLLTCKSQPEPEPEPAQPAGDADAKSK